MPNRALAIAGLAFALTGLGASADARPFTASSDELKITVGGALQPRVSYGIDDESATDRFGFGLRRARLRASATWANVVLGFDVDLSAMAPFDLHVGLTPAEGWHVRVGYFAGAQPRGLIPTGLAVIDGVDRSAILERWARLTIGGAGRDVGADVTYANRYVTASLWLHSGYGGFARGVANVLQSPSGHAAAGADERSGFALSGALAFTPQDGLEIGGFASHNTAGGAPVAFPAGFERTVTSWSAHAYYGPKPGSQFLRLKAEVVGLSVTGDAGGPAVATGPPPEVDLSHIGAAGTAALGLIPHGEIFGRFEVFDEDDGGDLTRYLEAGIMFSLSAMDDGPFDRERLTLSYGNAVRGADTDHFAVLQGQWLF